MANKKNWKAYWKFMFANSTGIIDAEILQLVGVAFLTSFITVIQHALEQYKPSQTFEN